MMDDEGDEDKNMSWQVLKNWLDWGRLNESESRFQRWGDAHREVIFKE